MPVSPSSFAARPSLLSSLGYQSFVLVSPHLLQPGRPLLAAVSDTSLSCWLALICCSLAALSSAVSDASLPLLVARICCNVLSLLSELCAARLALSRSRRCLNLLVRPFRQRGVSFLVPSYAVVSHICSAKIL